MTHGTVVSRRYIGPCDDRDGAINSSVSLWKVNTPLVMNSMHYNVSNRACPPPTASLQQLKSARNLIHIKFTPQPDPDLFLRLKTPSISHAPTVGRVPYYSTLQGPTSTVRATFRGLSSLLRHASAGTLSSVSGVTNALSRNLRSRGGVVRPIAGTMNLVRDGQSAVLWSSRAG